MSNWENLDVVAALFAAVTNNNNSAVFRVSSVLNEPVNVNMLQAAINKIYNRFPMMFVKIRRGVFWNYYDTNTNEFLVQKETDYPCNNIIPANNRDYQIKVLYYQNRISLEILHSVTDAGGALELLKSILYYYLSFKYGEFDSQDRILLINQSIEENMYDSFKSHFNKQRKSERVKNNSKVEKAFKLTGTQYADSGNNVITGLIDAKKLNQIAKQNGATITSYITSLLAYSIYQSQQKYTYSKKKIVIVVPVNLRNDFESKTLRNFAGVVNLSVKINSSTKLEDIINIMTSQLKLQTSKENLTVLAHANTAVVQNTLVRAIPLFVKKILVRISFNALGEKKKTMTVSNVGIIRIPDKMCEYISHIEPILYPTIKSPISCALASVNNKLAITFSRSIEDSDVIRLFFKYLSEIDKLDVDIYSNDWGNRK